MEYFSTFVNETYEHEMGSKISVKNITSDFRSWLVSNSYVKQGNEMSRKELLANIRNIPNCAYKRFTEGYYVVGLIKKDQRHKPVRLNIIRPTEPFIHESPKIQQHKVIIPILHQQIIPSIANKPYSS